MSTAPTTLLCPRCRNELSSANAAGVGMAVCDLCGGVWVDNQGATRIMAAMHVEAVKVARDAAQGAMAAAPTERMINCPACGAEMERTSAGATDVVVDRCAKHGTWFDRNELIMASNLAEQNRQSSPASLAAKAAAPAAPAPTAAAGGPPRPAGPPRPGQASGDLVRKILR